MTGAKWNRGDPVTLVRTTDPYLLVGLHGVVDMVDSLGTVHVAWEAFGWAGEDDVWRERAAAGNARRGVEPGLGCELVDRQWRITRPALADALARIEVTALPGDGRRFVVAEMMADAILLALAEAPAQ